METDDLHFPPTGVLIIWDWLKCKSDDIHTDEKSEDEGSDNTSDDARSAYDGDCSEPEDDREQYSKTDKIVFKCIGATKCSSYQSALKRARDIGFSTVCVQLFPEPLNPRDARAIAFKCELDGKLHTIGYNIIVSELLEEVHAALDSGSILCVELAWVQ